MSPSSKNSKDQRKRRSTPDRAGMGRREAELRRERNVLRRALKILGPGLITGASDDDPSGIGTYATAGASLGFSVLWTSLVSFPMMAAVQFMCAKIALTSGRGLAGVIRRHYSRKLLLAAMLALVIANTVNAGADIGAIAAGVNLFVPIPISAMIIPITLVILVLLVWGTYRTIANTFRWLTLALLAYGAAAVVASPDAGEVLRGTFIPTFSFDSAFLAALVAILGTTISPYLWFWQASQEVEEEVSMGRRYIRQREGTTEAELRYTAWDTNIGMLLSNGVMYFIILTTAATLNRAGFTEVNSAADAATALRPLAGDAATLLFGLGLIGAGFLAVPVLVGSSAYALSEAFGWKFGLDEKPTKAWQFYLVIVASMLVGMEINFLGISTIDALFWTAVINGLIAPPLLVIIMLVANNKSIMGEHTNGLNLNILGWATTAAMFAAAVGLIATWIIPF